MFLDEGGDLGFHAKGSAYFSITSLSAIRPFPWDIPLTQYKYDLLEYGLDIQGFHATQDNSHVRGRVLGLIAGMIGSFRADTVIVEKRKTGPALRQENQFYPRMLGYLVRHVITTQMSPVAEVIVITDTLPLAGKRNAIEKAVKETLSRMLPPTAPYRVVHHTSASCQGLQAADYCNWAIWKKWERGDLSSYNMIKGAIQSEFDIFRKGTTHYY